MKIWVTTLFGFVGLGSGAMSVYGRNFFGSTQPETVIQIEKTSFPVKVSRGVVIRGLSRQNRPIEEYDLSVFPPELMQRIDRQIVADRQYDVFTPRTDSMEGSEITPMGQLTFAQTIYQGKYTVIYSLRENSKLLIKYQANCDEIWRSNDTNLPLIHPLLMDHWYSSDASKFGLSVKTLFVSPPALLCQERFGKCHFDFDSDKYDQCFRDWGTIRYMVMERSSGMDLYDIRVVFNRGVVPFTRVMSIAVLLIKALEQLHMNAGIIHGDIHPGNIMIESGGGSKQHGVKNLKFIDFARSKKRTFLPENRIFDPGYYNHYMYTEWQLEGFAWGARDDLMKAIQVIATIMNEYEYSEFEKSVSDLSYEDHLEYKKSAYFFELPNGFSPVGTLFVPKELKTQIRTHFSRVLSLVRNLTNTNAIPPYGEIVSAFVECQSLVDAFR